VILYMPCVVRADGIYKMWYVGSSDHARSPSYIHLGYATSEDGVQWEEQGDPIVTDDQIPWGRVFQTPYVLYDTEEKSYKMWFTARIGWKQDENGRRRAIQRVGYAKSPDGISWAFHPEPVARGRRPFVQKSDDGSYRMWVGAQSRANPEMGLGKNLITARSEDGTHWEEEGDVIRPAEMFESCVYPFVMGDRGELGVWFGSHHKDRATGWFDITFALSKDGFEWSQVGRPVFPASSDKAAFDGRYTSTPHVLKLPGKYTMYYSARDMDDYWTAPDGSRQRDTWGIYEHIGYAYIPVEEKEDPTLGFSWSVDGNPVAGGGKSYHFHPHKAGAHTVTCRVENANGSASYTWDIDVKD
jgi:predicted GH43/DUF377 family glycosyl hydrolase